MTSSVRQSLFRHLRSPYVRAQRAASTALFDRRYGVDTEGVIQPAEMGIFDENSTRYAPARLTSLRRILPPSEVDERDVFLDFGSGKGRVVLQAAMNYPFTRVYGVELAGQLHATAMQNLAASRDRLRCRDVRLVNANAMEFEIPDEVTIAFLYNPFVGKVFETVIERLLCSVDHAPRPLRIIYGNPREEATLLRTGRVRQVRQLRGWRPGREWSRSNSYRMYEVT
jgi:hypothetical protein